MSSIQTGAYGSLLTLRMPVNADQKAPRKNLLLVLDCSGSMAGSSWKQIQQAVAELVEDGVAFDVAVYGSSYQLTTAQHIASMGAGGGTDFADAYKGIQNYLLAHIRDPVDIVFMTDGQDGSGGREAPGRQALTLAIRAMKVPVVINCIGLGADHDFSLLQKLADAGSQTGLYRFVKSALGREDGATSLSGTVREIAGWASDTLRADVRLSLAEAPVHATFTMNDAGDALVARVWTTSADLTSVTVVTPGTTNNQVLLLNNVNCDIFYELQAIRQAASSAGTLQEVQSLQKRLLAVREARFEKGQLMFIERKARAAAIEAEVQQIQPVIDQMLSVLAKVGSAMSRSADVMAMFRSLQSQATFTKVRRQRAIDERLASSSDRTDAIAEALRMIPPISPEEISAVDAETYTCDVSHASVIELLTETPDDILGFGVTVARSEVAAVDAPSLVRILSLSSTLVSMQSFLDSARYHSQQLGSSAGVLGNLQGVDGAQGVMVGRGRETFNAFLPLRICDTHHARVSALLPLICGQFFCLAPEAYDRKQIEGLYSVLAQLVPLAAESGWQMQLVNEYAAFLGHIKLENPLYGLSAGAINGLANLPERFVKSPMAREKSNLSTLNILFGVIKARSVAQNVDVELINKQTGLDSCLKCELVRRVANSSLAADPGRRYPDVRSILYGGHVAAVAAEVCGESNYGTSVEWTRWLNSGFAGPSPSSNTSHGIPIAPYVPLQIAKEDERMLSCARMMFTEFVGKESKQVFSSAGAEIASLLQALYAPNNDNFHELVEAGVALVDPEVEEQRMKLYEYLHLKFDGSRLERWNACCATLLAEDRSSFIAMHNDLEVFAAMLHDVSPARGGISWPLVVDILTGDSSQVVPLLIPKLYVVVTGLLPDGRVILGSEGVNGWVAGAVVAARVRQLMRGDKLLYKLEKMMEGLELGHVYRASDKPNRHGYCNSHPNYELISRWDM